MDKIKTSELFSNMIVNSQKAMIQEDNNICQAIYNSIDLNSSVSWIQIIELINISHEYIRMVYIKGIIKTLIDYDLIENDTDLDNIDISNIFLSKSVKNVIENENS